MAKKIIMYGNENCKDCVEAKKVLDAEGIRYGYVDVLGGLAHLKKFITLRDAHQDKFQSEIAKEHMGCGTCACSAAASQEGLPYR